MDKATTIYLDIEDDITAIIGKIKAAEDTLVALVVPKRTNVLQSAVNLKLINKTANELGKKVALITRDSTLLTLAGRLGLLASPNLQTAPQVPEVSIGAQADLPSDTIEEATQDMPDPVAPSAPAATKTPVKTVAPVGTKIPLNTRKKGFKIPDFERFKKRFILGGVALVGLILFMWFATQVWPKALVTIHARTSPLDTNFEFTLDASVKQLDREKLILPALSEEISKTLTANFTATEQKDVGTKAGGEMEISNCFYSSSRTLPAGSTFTAGNGRKFASTEAVTVPGASFAGACVTAGEATVSVQAVENGDSYNLSPTSYTVDADANLDAQGSQMSGGTSRMATVVAQADVDKAKTELLEKERAVAKKELVERFSESERVIEETFTESVAETVSEPAVGQEATTARVVLKVTYFVLGSKQEDLNELIKYQQSKQIESNPSEPKAIVETGLDKTVFKTVETTSNNRRKLQLTTQGLVGPDLKLDQLPGEVAGKGYNEAIEHIKRIPQVNGVEVELSPFWVFSMPDEVEKITIKVQ